ncbi:MAG: FAD binding domain-containing protein [Thermoanaerobaculia bacterium]|nr:FAD binding domain-containing protein [Thermoanaerobaculia bacterium]MBP9823567.1 FAD binding domain-containing protein [Thermoanaerobaculia bacterium]
MRGDLTACEVLRPRRLAAALAALAEPERPMPLAGGTDLFVLLNDGRQPARRFLDLTLLDELRGIERSPAGLRIGARTTYTELRRSRTILRRAPVLAEMAATVGAAAIQNRGTLGGSLGNASPASDPAPVLLALDASVELARREGRRVERRIVPLSTYFTGYRATAARPDELVTSILIPAEALAGWRYAYRKVGTRRAQAISKVVAAVALTAPGTPVGRRAARIAFGSVAPTTVRAFAAEGALLGRRLDATAAAEARESLLARDIRPIDDLRSTADYRGLVAGRILVTLLAELGGFSAADLLSL